MIFLLNWIYLAILIPCYGKDKTSSQFLGANQQKSARVRIVYHCSLFRANPLKGRDDYPTRLPLANDALYISTQPIVAHHAGCLLQM
jgi:hypothetical protein